MTHEEAECAAYKAEYDCLLNVDCGSDTACELDVIERIVQVRNKGNSYIPGCIN
jgi:hypothetical protein